MSKLTFSFCSADSTETRRQKKISRTRLGNEKINIINGCQIWWQLVINHKQAITHIHTSDANTGNICRHREKKVRIF